MSHPVNHEGRCQTTGCPGFGTIHSPWAFDKEVSPADSAERAAAWEHVARGLCAHVEMILDDEPDADGYRLVGPSWAEAVKEYVYAVLQAGR